MPENTTNEAHKNKYVSEKRKLTKSGSDFTSLKDRIGDERLPSPILKKLYAK